MLRRPSDVVATRADRCRRRVPGAASSPRSPGGLGPRAGRRRSAACSRLTSSRRSAPRSTPSPPSEFVKPVRGLLRHRGRRPTCSPHLDVTGQLNRPHHVARRPVVGGVRRRRTPGRCIRHHAAISAAAAASSATTATTVSDRRASANGLAERDDRQRAEPARGSRARGRPSPAHLARACRSTTSGSAARNAVDVLGLGRAAAQRDPDVAVGQRAHRRQHAAGRERRRRARRAARHAVPPAGRARSPETRRRDRGTRTSPGAATGRPGRPPRRCRRWSPRRRGSGRRGRAVAH